MAHESHDQSHSTTTEMRLRSLSRRLSTMHEPTEKGASHEALRALERDAARDRQRLRNAEAQLDALRAEVECALASTRAGSAMGAGPEGGSADELALALRLDLARERRLRDESDEVLGHELALDLARLGEEIEGERGAREAQEARLRKANADGLRGAYAALDAERAAREGAHASFLSMLEELARRTRDELARERRQRQATDELVREMADRLGIA